MHNTSRKCSFNKLKNENIAQHDDDLYNTRFLINYNNNIMLKNIVNDE